MNETLTDTIVEFFDWYVLYCLPIHKVEFDFANQSLRLDLCDYEIRDDQDLPLQLVFKKVSKYTFEYPSDEFLFDMRTIYRAKLEKITENEYELALKIDMPEIILREGKHHEFTVGKMLIGFADMEVIGGLSREAMEYKWKEEE